MCYSLFFYLIHSNTAQILASPLKKAAQSPLLFLPPCLQGVLRQLGDSTSVSQAPPREVAEKRSRFNQDQSPCDA